jgi:hypothetical protein
MADNLSIDHRTSALLVMDFQTLIVDNTDCWSSAIAALTSTRKRIGCCWRRSFRGRLPSRRLRDSRKPSGRHGRRRRCYHEPA